MNKYRIRLHGTSIESLWNKYSVIFQYFMCHYSHNMIGLLPFKRSKSLVYETWKCLTTGEFMQNGASRPLLVLLYFGLNFLRSQFAFTWHFTFISRVQDGCSSSIIFKSYSSFGGHLCFGIKIHLQLMSIPWLLPEL